MADTKKFSEVYSKVDFPKLEIEILDYWKDKKIFKKSLENRAHGKPFVFYEGPPTANGKPGIHHVEARSFKDVIPRYKTMRGYYCERRAGWDCHGLPVELEVEKKLGISGKRGIEKYGIAEFCSLCRDSVYEYVREWQKLTERMGYWVDLESAYETLDNKYIESEWWILKTVWDKGLLYEDFKVVPYCPRCGTSLSSHELAQGYKDDVEDPSLYLKFKLKDNENTYFLVWTTTPWTLPGNVALAVDPDEDYVYVEAGGETFILAQARREALGLQNNISRKVKGKNLLGLTYEPLYSFVNYDKKAHFVVPSKFVSMDEGTGIVHTAVMYGEDDFALGEENNLPKKHLVNERGEFIEEVKPFSGMFVKKADPKIIEDLESRNILFRNEKIKHTYPFCWRCSSPLLYYAMPSWFLKTTALKKELLKNNNSVNWYPEHIKSGRMGEWLDNNKDWALSRSRYWGTPLPVWRCGKCGELEVFGSIDELSGRSGKDLSKLDLHKPYIDEITFKCDKCGGTSIRDNYVLDCWFDSGSMPYGQLHYPFENKDKFENNFPADFISEAIDQTRGWFYTLLAVSTLLDRGPAYKNVICLGHVLDEKGNKMSKSKGNVIDPMSIMDSVGADATRWYFYSATSPGPSFRFSENLVRDVIKRFFLTLWNSYVYFVTYANLNNWQRSIGKRMPLDEWIIADFQNTVNGVTEFMDNYDMYNSAKLIEEFVVNDLSNWYIRRSRGRSDNAFLSTLHEILANVCKLIAPMAPFVSEKIYLNLMGGSVHLSDWPDAVKLGSKESSLIKDMKLIREVVEKAHSIRKEKGIPVRQPLAELAVESAHTPDKSLWPLICEEINVKKVYWNKGIKLSLKLDTKITAELENEGKVRELIRKIQGERKKLGVELDQNISVTAPWLPENKEHIELIKQRTLASSLAKGEFSIAPE